MINNVVLLGRLVATPELRKTANDNSVANFTLAVDRSYCKAGAERQCDFIDCVAWKGTGEFVSKYFSKGQMIAVTGAIQMRNYTDKSGIKRKATEILVNSASFCESKKAERATLNQTLTRQQRKRLQNMERKSRAILRKFNRTMIFRFEIE